MDSETFTCPECQQTLSIDELAAPFEDSGPCKDCYGDSQHTAQSPHTSSARTTEEDQSGISDQGSGGHEEPGDTGTDEASTDGNDAGITVEKFWDSEAEVGLREVSSADVPSASESGSSRRGDSLDRRIDNWKEQLLDLTRRNTLIDFTETKTKSLPLNGRTPPNIAADLRDGDVRVRKLNDDVEDSHDVLTENEVMSSRPPEETAESLYRIGLNEKQFLRERGVDTLYLVLGSVEWYAPDEPDDAFDSPLFLAPVDLEQTPVSGGELHNYVIYPEGDDLILNPALRKKVQSEVRLDLPPDEALGLECIDAAFEEVHGAIQGFDGWRLHDDVVLGVFDFAKYSIYSDLETNRAEVRSNPFVQALDDDPTAIHESEADIEPIPAGELDEKVDLEDVYQVLDADSSQQAAIEAAKSGRSFVIQGPPGTGKSQTIANIISEKLAAGDTVLFVSEKQAALNVVKNRLDDVGLGRFCLEAHGRKATKASVLQSLEEEVQSKPVKEAPNRAGKLTELADRRDTLNEFGEVLLTAPEGFTVTPFEAFGIVAENRDLPSIEIGSGSLLSLDQATLDAARDELDELGYFDTEIESYTDHPWRHTTLDRWRVDTAARVDEVLSAHANSIRELADHASQIESRLGFTVSTCSEFGDAVDLLGHLTERPAIEWHEQHVADDFLSLGERLDEFAAHMRRIEELRSQLLDEYEESFLGVDGNDLHSSVSRYGALRFLRPGYYTVRNQVMSHSREEYEPGFKQLQEDARQLMELQQLQAAVDEYSDVETALGPLYQGRATEWGELLSAHEWVTELQSHPFDTSCITDALIAGELTDVESLFEQAEEAWDRFTAADADTREFLDIDEVTVNNTDFYDAEFESASSHLLDLADRVDELEGWVRFQQQLAELQETIAAEYVTRFLEEEHPPEVIVSAFEKRFFTRWLNELYNDTILGEFNPDTFSKYLADFRRLDQEQQELAKIAVQHRVTSQRPQLDLEHADSSEQVILRREIQKQRQHKPLRELFDEAGSFITKLKPCFMMSPLSVAQYLKKDSITFDTVIFDEASQVMPEDAVSSIIRGEQVIIAGDTKQLPPTTFFDTDTETAADVREDLDSILEEAAAILPEVNLTWHYRSRSAELIEFSNQLYYNGRLQTFPENDAGTKTGVEFVHVEDGVYDRGGTRRNEVEAERVADLVADHAATDASKSLGVVAFSVAQEEAIREALEARRDDDAALDRFLDEDDILGEFFVKNLEMVQGDERDRMIFSVGYGPDEDGEITMNFGPLNAEGGERRLNVAVTRARERVTVVSSMLPDDIDLGRTSSTGVEHFKRYLEYAYDGGATEDAADAAEGLPESASSLAWSVYETLSERGYTVSNVSTSGYSLDLALYDDESADTAALGIELDGSAYTWSNTARDRDRIRPTVLEDLGWRTHRVWAPDWVTNKERAVKQIESKLDTTTEDPSTEDVPEIGEIEVATYEPEEYSREELEALQDEVATYRSPDTEATRDLGLETASPETVQQVLVSVVLEHGPIHRDEAFRVIAARFDEPRRTPTVKETLDTHLNSLRNKGRVILHDEFLWPQKSDLEFAVRQNTDDSRSIDRIPQQEIGLAVALILNDGFSMTREDLVVETARLFGYERVGTRINERVNKAIDDLQENQFISDDERLSIESSISTIRQALLDDVYARRESPSRSG